jgi:hypothetical protein
MLHSRPCTLNCYVLSYITTDGQSASLSWNKAPIWSLRPDLYYCLTISVFGYGAPSLTRGRVCLLNVQYTIYFTVSDLRPGPCIYIPQEQGGPVIPPDTGFRLFQTAAFRISLSYKHSAPIPQKTLLRYCCVT